MHAQREPSSRRVGHIAVLLRDSRRILQGLALFSGGIVVSFAIRSGVSISGTRAARAVLHAPRRPECTTRETLDRFSKEGERHAGSISSSGPAREVPRLEGHFAGQCLSGVPTSFAGVFRAPLPEANGSEPTPKPTAAPTLASKPTTGCTPTTPARAGFWPTGRPTRAPATAAPTANDTTAPPAFDCS